MKFKLNQKFGFTLIELLIVMAIIAVLAGVSIFALSGSRESGRNARRQADLQSIASALEIYKADCDFYPNALPSSGSSFTGSQTPCSLSSNTYMQIVPDDPTASTLDYKYVPLPSSCDTPPGNCTQYRVWARLEGTITTPAGCSSPPDCGTSLACNYCVFNP